MQGLFYPLGDNSSFPMYQIFILKSEVVIPPVQTDQFPVLLVHKGGFVKCTHPLAGKYLQLDNC